MRKIMQRNRIRLKAVNLAALSSAPQKLLCIQTYVGSDIVDNGIRCYELREHGHHRRFVFASDGRCPLGRTPHFSPEDWPWTAIAVRDDIKGCFTIGAPDDVMTGRFRKVMKRLVGLERDRLGQHDFVL